jgi:hypothetical protein
MVIFHNMVIPANNAFINIPPLFRPKDVWAGTMEAFTAKSFFNLLA